MDIGLLLEDLKILLALAQIVIGAYFLKSFFPVRLWISTWSSGVWIPFGKLIAMKFRQVPAKAITALYIKAQKEGIKDFSLDDFETHFLAGGDPKKVVNAILEARQQSIDLETNTAVFLDISGVDLFECIEMHESPKGFTVKSQMFLNSDALLICTLELLIQLKEPSFNILNKLYERVFFPVAVYCDEISKKDKSVDPAALYEKIKTNLEYDDLDISYFEFKGLDAKIEIKEPVFQETKLDSFLYKIIDRFQSRKNN